MDGWFASPDLLHARLLASGSSSELDANLTSGDCGAETSHGGHECGGGGGVALGVIVHVVGSVGINLGQNIQALALSRRPELVTKPFKSKLWLWGMALFIAASIVTFSALALAPASILVPLESIQFIVNIAFNKIVRGKRITLGMYAGVGLIIGGIVLFVLFGPSEDECFSAEQLRCFWTAAGWWVYLVISFGIAAVTYVAWRRYEARTKMGRPIARSRIVEPVCYTLSASLFGGGQMIVHTKMVAELFQLVLEGTHSLTDWFFWLELLLVAVFGCYWLFRFTQCLAMYDPLFIIPLMQTAFMMFGAIAGGLFFQEFALLEAHQFILYALGLVLCVVGLAFIAANVEPENGAAGGNGRPPTYGENGSPPRAVAQYGGSPASAPTAAKEGVDMIVVDPVRPISPKTEQQQESGGGSSCSLQ